MGEYPPAVRSVINQLDHIAMRCVGINEFIGKLGDLSIEHRSSSIPEIYLTQLFFKDPAGITIELNFEGEELLEM